MIRSAENFIYLENQYFLGSAYSWMHEEDIYCNHLIPMELTQRIVEKIHADQRFVVYAVIPMFPEGNPASKPSQVMLDCFALSYGIYII